MNEILKKVWSWVEKNRWTVIAPIVGMVIWVAAVGCTPTATSPITGDEVTPYQLQVEFDVYMHDHEIVLRKFQAAEDEIARQREEMEKMKEVLLALASGSVADWPGLVQLLIGGGALGFVLDNVRKNAVIAGLKRAVDGPSGN
ncbi:MAG: hypothetical protein WCR98_06015 [Saccharofermentanales bacterium]